MTDIRLTTLGRATGRRNLLPKCANSSGPKIDNLMRGGILRF